MSKKNVQDLQIPDSRYFLSSQIPDFLGFNSQIPDFMGLYSLIPDADSPPPSSHLATKRVMIFGNVSDSPSISYRRKVATLNMFKGDWVGGGGGGVTKQDFCYVV